MVKKMELCLVVQLAELPDQPEELLDSQEQSGEWLVHTFDLVELADLQSLHFVGLAAAAVE